MSDIDPRNWSRQHQIALIVAVVVGMVLGGVVGLTASEVQPPAFMYSDAGGGE
jgi:ABC-type xylose transport system permease subunit